MLGMDWAADVFPRSKPVGQKVPIFILGQPLYDMFGNVGERVRDSYGNTASFRGGNYKSTAGNLTPGNFDLENSQDLQRGIYGFRIARERP